MSRPKRQPRTIGRSVKRGGRYSESLALNPKTGELERDYRARPTRWQGRQVNDPAPLPKSPDPQLIDQDQCSICGELYKSWRGSGCSIDQIEPTGPFKSRGTMLWALRLCKMREWYQRHYICLEWHRDPDFRRLRLSEANTFTLIHGPGCLPWDTDLTPSQRRWIEGADLLCDDEPVPF